MINMQNRKIVTNAIMSVVEVIVIACVLFILYRFLLNTIGVEQLGVWSVVLATTSVASITNLGLSASVVKFVAKYAARGQGETVADVIQTSAISLGVLIGLILSIVSPFISLLLSLVVPIANLKEALSILPYALSSLWMTALSSVFQSGLDGYQRIDLRSILLMAGALIYLILCFILVPTYGLMGLAYAQVAQAGLLLIGSWVILKRHLPLLPVVPCHWNQKLFREMVGYGLSFQVISISQTLYDPVTKSLLTKFGGLEMTGFYEIASRMIIQLRGLLVTVNQVLVPAIADLAEKNPEYIQIVYKDSYRLLVYITLPIFSAVIASIPIISQVWIGHYESIFVIFAILLAVGWFLNTLAAPAYFANLGIGELRWNTIGHVIIAVSNIGLGWLLGSIFGGTAVVLAWVFSLITGSLVIPISYHYRHKIPITELVPKENRVIGLASVAGMSISLLLYYQMNNQLSPPVLATVVALVFSTIVIFPVWLHPMRKRSIGWITDEFLQVHRVMIEK
jgi:O-antigen/teichoic acid export membrane protein